MNYQRIYTLFLMVMFAVVTVSPARTELGSTGNTERLMGQLNCPGPIRSTPVSDRDTIYIGCDSGHFFALNRKTGSPRWSIPADAAVSSRPAAAGDLIFFSTKKGTLYAVYQHQHQKEGKEAWRFASDANAESLYEGGWDYFISSPVIAGALVIFGSGDHHVYALGWQTGSLAWKHDTGAVVRGRFYRKEPPGRRRQKI